MAQLPLDEGIDRFQQNEDRLDKFVNDPTGYVASTGAVVESIPAFLVRQEQEIEQSTGTVASNLQASQIARSEAEAARDAAVVNSTMYPDEATGRAAVADGAYFKVIGTGSVACLEYRRTNGSTSVLVAIYPAESALGETVDAELPAVRNIFDPLRATSGKYVNPAGNLASDVSYFVSSYIRVAGGAQYTFGGAGASHVAFYSISKQFISYQANPVTITTPSGTHYLRFSHTLGGLTKTMLVLGASAPSLFISFASEDSATASFNRMMSARSAVDAALPAGRNLFDLNRALDNTAVSPENGTLYSASGYFATPSLPVTPGGYLYSTIPITGAWLNRDGNFLSGISGLIAQPAIVPSGAYFVRFQVYSLSNKASLVVTNQQTAPAGYVPFIGTESSAHAWQGKKLDVLGDSISESGLWIPYFTAGTGCVLQNNHAKAGRSVREMGKTAAGVVLQVSDLTNTDLITIFGGTNDYGGNRSLGSIADAVVGNSATTFYADVFNLLTLLYTLKPTVRVMFITPLIRGAMSGSLAGQPSYPDPNYSGATLPQYVQAIKDVCRLFSVPVCDLFSEGGLNLLNLSTYTGDNLHPNGAGTVVYVRRVISVANGL